MNHSNLRIIVDNRANHPYGVTHRLQFFAHHAGVKLVDLEKRKHFRTFAITRG